MYSVSNTKNKKKYSNVILLEKEGTVPHKASKIELFHLIRSEDPGITINDSHGMGVWFNWSWE